MLLDVLQVLVMVILGAPTAALLLLAVTGWVSKAPSERFTTRLVAAAFLASLAAGVGAGAMMVFAGVNQVSVPLGTWFAVGHYAFHWNLVLDRLSVPFVLLAAALVGMIGAFSARYLHREPGFSRFYLLMTLFGMAVQLVVLAGSLDLLFFGWELVGLTSALLIAFFHERKAPVRHGLRAFITYRVCDTALLTAAVWLHHTTGASALVSSGQPWATIALPGAAGDVLLVALLLLFASMGKSAQFPMGGWLPRAMEGPTPSSAIFYGSLSIHLGPYLLLRNSEALTQAPWAAAAVVAVGAVTAMHATLVGRVQTDIKSVLAYASMTQVGIILVEIGLGLRFVAVVHVVGHACVRTLQVLRSPSLLHDHHHLEQAMGRQLPRTGGHIERLVPARWQPWLYRLALERSYLDSLLRDHLVGGLVAALLTLDRLEERWVAVLGGEPAPSNVTPNLRRRARVNP